MDRSAVFTDNDTRGALTRRPGLLTTLAYGFVVLMALLPILLVEVPPLVDYPNHLARLHILAGFESEPLFQRNYLIEWRWIPNLAIDLAGTLLAPLVSPMTAGRVFLVFTVLATAGGVVALHKVLFGRVGIWPLASFALAYSLPFAWGLVNFQFSVGLCLLCCAAWVATGRWHPIARILIFNLAASAIYFAHLFGYLALVLIVGLYELNSTLRGGDRADLMRRLFGRVTLSAAAFVMPAILLLIGLFDREDGITPLALGTWQGDVFSKLTALFSAALFHGSAADIFFIAVVGMLIATAIISRGFRLATGFAWPLVGLLAITLFGPSIFQGLFFDGRFGFVLGCLFVAATNPIVTPPVLRAGLHIALISIIALRFDGIIQVWQARERDYASFRELVRAVEPGSRLLPVHDTGNPTTELSYSVRWYMASVAMPSQSLALSWRNIDTLAVIERQVYTPVVFKNPSAQPLRSVPALRDIDPVAASRRVSASLFIVGARTPDDLRRRAAEHHEVAFWADWPRHFDYVVVMHYPGVVPTRFEGLPLIPVATKDRFTLYRVARP